MNSEHRLHMEQCGTGQNSNSPRKSSATVFGRGSQPNRTQASAASVQKLQLSGHSNVIRILKVRCSHSYFLETSGCFKCSVREFGFVYTTDEGHLTIL